MSEYERPTYFATIPSTVRYDKELPPNAKLLYGEITALGYANGYCYASDQYFAELYGVTVKCVQNWLKALESKGYIEIHQLKVENIFRRGIFFPKNVENIFRSNNTSNNNKKENYIREKAKSSATDTAPQPTASLISPNQPTKCSLQTIDTFFDKIYALYPRKINRKKGLESFRKRFVGLTEADAKAKANVVWNLLQRQIVAWQNEHDGAGRPQEYMPYFSSWFNANF